MTANTCPCCHRSWIGHDNTRCETDRLVRAVVTWRAALARHRGHQTRGPVTRDARITASYALRDAEQRFADATAGIPGVERLRRALIHEHTAMCWALDTPRGRADYAAGYRQAHPSHPIHAAVRDALRDVTAAYAA